MRDETGKTFTREDVQRVIEGAAHLGKVCVEVRDKLDSIYECLNTALYSATEASQVEKFKFYLGSLVSLKEGLIYPAGMCMETVNTGNKLIGYYDQKMKNLDHYTTYFMGRSAELLGHVMKTLSAINAWVQSTRKFLYISFYAAAETIQSHRDSHNLNRNLTHVASLKKGDDLFHELNERLSNRTIRFI